MLVCLDRFLAIFCPFWYKDTMTPALAYFVSFVTVVLVTTPWTLFIIMGWITHPFPMNGNCYVEVSQNYWHGIQIFIAMSVVLPGSISLVSTGAVFYHRKRRSSTNREFFHLTNCVSFETTNFFWQFAAFFSRHSPFTKESSFWFFIFRPYFI